MTHKTVVQGSELASKVPRRAVNDKSGRKILFLCSIRTSPDMVWDKARGEGGGVTGERGDSFDAGGAERETEKPLQ